MLSFVPLMLSAMLAVPAASPLTESAVLESPTRHVRTADASMKALLKRGFRKSPAFATLMRRLQYSDVIVYVEEVPRLPGALEGRLVMLPVAHGQRYVRIQIALRGAPEDWMAVLGHELQHAVEVADALNVRDQAGMIELYERIGTRGGDHVYDTAAAQEMGRTVKREVTATS
jgi:hypothetical protein